MVDEEVFWCCGGNGVVEEVAVSGELVDEDSVESVRLDT